MSQETTGKYSEEQALESLLDYVFAEEHNEAINCMAEFETCDEWMDHILAETIYGAAQILAFRNLSDSAMYGDLRSMWRQKHRP